jgi:hypothetical protein
MYRTSGIVTTVKSNKMAAVSSQEANKFAHDLCGETGLKIVL